MNKILLHPNFDTDNIAVIYLKEAITITDYVSPIALPSPNAYKLNIVNGTFETFPYTLTLFFLFKGLITFSFDFIFAIFQLP